MVWEAKAVEALEVLKAHSKEVHVLSADMNMPGSIDGIALAEQVYQGWPGVLLLTSFGDTRMHPDEIPDNGHIVPKPYHGATLVWHITEMVQTLRRS